MTTNNLSEGLKSKITTIVQKYVDHSIEEQTPVSKKRLTEEVSSIVKLDVSTIKDFVVAELTRYIAERSEQNEEMQEAEQSSNALPNEVAETKHQQSEDQKQVSQPPKKRNRDSDEKERKKEENEVAAKKQKKDDKNDQESSSQPLAPAEDKQKQRQKEKEKENEKQGGGSTKTLQRETPKKAEKNEKNGDDKKQTEGEKKKTEVNPKEKIVNKKQSEVKKQKEESTPKSNKVNKDSVPEEKEDSDFESVSNTEKEDEDHEKQNKEESEQKDSNEKKIVKKTKPEGPPKPKQIEIFSLDDVTVRIEPKETGGMIRISKKYSSSNNAGEESKPSKGQTIRLSRSELATIIKHEEDISARCKQMKKAMQLHQTQVEQFEAKKKKN